MDWAIDTGLVISEEVSEQAVTPIYMWVHLIA